MGFLSWWENHSLYSRRIRWTTGRKGMHRDLTRNMPVHTVNISVSCLHSSEVSYFLCIILKVVIHVHHSVA
jgi:hypothetical protein